MGKKSVLLFSFVVLVACASPEEMAAKKKKQEQENAAVCRSYGLQPGGEAFAMCLLQLDLARAQQYDSFQAPVSQPHFDRTMTGLLPRK